MPLDQTINIYAWPSASSNDFCLIKYKIEFVTIKKDVMTTKNWGEINLKIK